MTVTNEAEKSEKKSNSFIEQIIINDLEKGRTEERYKRAFRPNPTVTFI